MLASNAATARAAVPPGNLIVNGGAETATGSSDSATTAPMPIPGWTSTTNFTEHTYDPAGSANFPDVNASAAVGGGSQFFAGGPDNGSGNSVETATQTVDVTVDAAQIDAGNVAATLSADLGGFASQEDQAELAATFLGAAGQQVGVLTVGPVTAEDRSDTTQLLPRTDTIAVPQGTRVIRVTMTATKFAGAYNDAYLDNISLSLVPASAGGQLPPPVIGKEVYVSVVKGKVFVRLPRAGGGGAAGSSGPGFVPLTAGASVAGRLRGRRACRSHPTRCRVGAGGGDTGRDLRRGGVRAWPGDQRSREGTDDPIAARGRFSRCPVVRQVPSAPRRRSRTRDRRGPQQSRPAAPPCHGQGSVSDPRALQRRDRARYFLGYGRPLRRHPDACASRHRGLERLVRHKTVTVHAGHNYLARAPGR